MGLDAYQIDTAQMITLNEIKIKGVDELVRNLNEFDKRHLPFALERALNKTMETVKGGLKREMQRVFSNPTPYALNALRIDYAKRKQDKFQSAIVPKEFGGEARKWLIPEIYGGSRGRKRFEESLISAGKMPSGNFAIPGWGMNLNQYGNVPPQRYVEILSALQAFSEAGYTMNRRTTKAAGKGQTLTNQVFAITSMNSGRGRYFKPGIYQKVGKESVRRLFLYKSGVSYRPRFHFDAVGKRLVIDNWEPTFNDAMKYAIDTAGLKGK